MSLYICAPFCRIAMMTNRTGSTSVAAILCWAKTEVDVSLQPAWSVRKWTFCFKKFIHKIQKYQIHPKSTSSKLLVHKYLFLCTIPYSPDNQNAILLLTWIRLNYSTNQIKPSTSTSKLYIFMNLLFSLNHVQCTLYSVQCTLYTAL